jgi:hypothetical protein
MTEAEARAALAAFDGLGGLEHWIAERPWDAAQDGWTVRHALHGWTFMVASAGTSEVRITAYMTGGSPAVWFVPAMRAGEGDEPIIGAPRPRAARC